MCIGLNYSDHAAESGMAIPAEPVLFMKATSAIAGPDDEVTIPKGSLKTDWEVELGVVIGTRAKDVPREDRITSYNVCYTKLLRDYRFRMPASSGNPSRSRSYDPGLLSVAPAGSADNLVITSYSIHYTKLYEFPSSVKREKD